MLRVWCVEEAGAGGGDRQSSHHNSRPTSSSPHTAPPSPPLIYSSATHPAQRAIVGFKLLSQGPQEDFWRRDFGWKLIFRIYSISSLFSTVNSPHQLLSQRNVFRIPPNTAEDKSTSIFTSSAAPQLKPYRTPLPSFPDPLLSLISKSWVSYHNFGVGWLCSQDVLAFWVRRCFSIRISRHFLELVIFPFLLTVDKSTWEKGTLP